MPAKSDPEYFKIVNMSSGMRNYWEVPNNSPTGKFDYIHEAAAVSKMAKSGTDPKVSESEEEEEIEEETENEPSESENSCDMDVDMLILNVREKLKMGTKFCTNPSNFWTEDPHEEKGGGGNFGVKSGTANGNCGNSNSIPIPVPVSNGSTEGNNTRWRNSSSNMYSSHYRWRHGSSHISHCPQQQQPSLSQYNKQIINGGIHKSHRSTSCSALWTSKLNHISKKKFPHGYNLLQELLESGSLIKEAVRRINGNPSIFTPITNNTSNGKNSLTQNCNFRMEEPERSFSTIQIGSPLTRNIIC